MKHLIESAKKASLQFQQRIVHNILEVADIPKVSVEEFERRIGICERCEHFNSESRKCQLCGCFMDEKAGLKEMPISKSKVMCSDKNNPKW